MDPSTWMVWQWRIYLWKWWVTSVKAVALCQCALKQAESLNWSGCSPKKCAYTKTTFLIHRASKLYNYMAHRYELVPFINWTRNLSLTSTSYIPPCISCFLQSIEAYHQAPTPIQCELYSLSSQSIDLLPSQRMRDSLQTRYPLAPKLLSHRAVLWLFIITTWCEHTSYSF